MSRFPLSFNRLAIVFILSFLSVFFIDFIFTVILVDRQPNSPLELAAYIALSTFLRAALADWLAVNVTGVEGTDKSKLSFWGLALAALIYGVPLLIISEHVLKPHRTVFFALFMWLDKVLPITYATLVFWYLLYVLIFDLPRLIVFFTIKKKLVYPLIL